jgi:hypothetical protein
MDFVTFKITGISPILMSNPANMRRGAGESAIKKRIPSAEEEAESLAYRNAQGQLYVPADWFRTAGLNATRGRRIGKVAASGPFKAGVFLTEPFCILRNAETDEPITEYELDTRRVVVQRQGVMRTRPMIQNWATYVTFEHDPEVISLKTVEDLLALAGKIIGVGGYRVEKGGPFGRFTVAQVTEEPDFTKVAVMPKAKGAA